MNIYNFVESFPENEQERVCSIISALGLSVDDPELLAESKIRARERLFFLGAAIAANIESLKKGLFIDTLSYENMTEEYWVLKEFGRFAEKVFPETKEAYV